MDVNRRNLMKGILAGGTLATLGMPGFTTAGIAPDSHPVKARSCILLLGNTRVDEAFAKGASTAHSVCSAGLGSAFGEPGALEVVKLKGGLLAEVKRVSELLTASRGARWVAVMDDASAAVFTEIVRNAGRGLLSRGTHASSRNVSVYPAFQGDSSSLLRHLWSSASPEQSPGALLAPRLVSNHNSFSIVENFLGEARSNGENSTGSHFFAPVFRSYESAGPLAMHMHCSGVSWSEACQLLGWEGGSGWKEFSGLREDGLSGQTAGEDWQPANWVEALGYAVTAVGLGISEKQEYCVRRGFVHLARQGERHNPGEAIFPEERFTSFIIEV